MRPVPSVVPHLILPGGHCGLPGKPPTTESGMESRMMMTLKRVAGVLIILRTDLARDGNGLVPNGVLARNK